MSEKPTFDDIVDSLAEIGTGKVTVEEAEAAEGLPMSPARKSPGGRIRNLRAMGDAKFRDLFAQMEGSSDWQARKAVEDEAEARGYLFDRTT